MVKEREGRATVTKTPVVWGGGDMEMEYIGTNIVEGTTKTTGLAG